MYDFVTKQAFNRFVFLDGIEDRIIYYLLSERNKDKEQLEMTYTLWKVLFYDTPDCLNLPLPSYKDDIVPLIYNGGTFDGSDISSKQNNKKIFRSPHQEEAWIQEGSLMRIYVDSIVPVNDYTATLNIGIDTLVHNRIIDIKAEENSRNIVDILPDGTEIFVSMKNRLTVMLRCILGLLNGAHVQGVGLLKYNQELSKMSQSRYALWNNRNFGGYKTIISTQISGVS